MIQKLNLEEVKRETEKTKQALKKYIRCVSRRSLLINNLLTKEVMSFLHRYSITCLIKPADAPEQYDWYAARYEEYLESVMDSTEEFHEIADIMARHATLQATNIDLKDQQQRTSDLAEHSRQAHPYFPR